MRFIPRNCIQPEAILAKPIFGANGRILLQDGIRMTDKYIERLEQLGIEGAYVHDPISEDLEIVSALSDELKSYAINNIYKTFSNAAGGDRNNPSLIQKTALQIVEEILEKGDVMFNLFDLKVYDSYTFFHCVNVTVLAIIIGIGVGYGKDELVNLAYSALLHDVGKVFIDPDIINKKGKLTDEEMDVVRTHPRIGYDYVKTNFDSNISAKSARGILEHHERVDGTGYPDGKSSEKIHEFGKIIAIADVYDALISDRPYRKGLFPVEAMEYVQGGVGRMFDFNFVNIFSQKVALFPVGTCVLLSNGATALVMENFEGFTARPRVKVFLHDQESVDPYLVNLTQEWFDATVIATVAM